MLDRIQSMQVLLKVIELGSLSAAARSLKLSPSMVTKHIAAQEARLGVRLLHRTTRRLVITETGRTYRDAIERIVAEVKEAEAFASADHQTVRGVLRVTSPVSFGAKEIAPLLAEFHLAYPALVVDLGLSDHFVDLVDEGRDVAIRIGRLAPSALIARRLAPCRMVLCGSQKYLARRGVPRRVSDLKDHECLGYTLSRTVGADLWSFGDVGEVTTRIFGHLRANNGEALVAAAIAGLGLTYQPTFMLADPIASGALTVLDLDHPAIELDGVYAVYPSSARLPAKVRVFIDYLAKAFGGVPPWERRLKPPRGRPARVVD